MAYDTDAEGDKGAKRLGQLSRLMQRVRLPVRNDVTAFWQAGGQIRNWVQFELARLRAAPTGRQAGRDDKARGR